MGNTGRSKNLWFQRCLPTPKHQKALSVVSGSWVGRDDCSGIRMYQRISSRDLLIISRTHHTISMPWSMGMVWVPLMRMWVPLLGSLEKSLNGLKERHSFYSPCTAPIISPIETFSLNSVHRNFIAWVQACHISPTFSIYLCAFSALYVFKICVYISNSDNSTSPLTLPNTVAFSCCVRLFWVQCPHQRQLLVAYRSNIQFMEYFSQDTLSVHNIVVTPGHPLRFHTDSYFKHVSLQETNISQGSQEPSSIWAMQTRRSSMKAYLEKEDKIPCGLLYSFVCFIWCQLVNNT